jgi:hypothetical protein
MATLEELKIKCIIPSSECDKLVDTYCKNNTSDKDFCGCSTNVLIDISDPKMSNSPVKCWAKTCTQNVNSYQFAAFQTAACPDICIDQSTITSIGSNITSSSFNQASCGSTQTTKEDSGLKNTLSELYKLGIGFSIAILIIIVSMSSSMLIVYSQIPSSGV